MAKITCLRAMFSRKGETKVTAAEGVEGDKLSELIQKGHAIEKDTTLFAMADSAVTESVGSMPQKLLSVPSIAEWATQDNVACWSATDLSHPEPVKTSLSDVFEFDTPDLVNVGSDEKIVSGKMKNSNCENNVGELVSGLGDEDPMHTGGEVAYEGGDEDDDIEKAPDSHISGTEHDSEGSGSGELSPDEECSGFTVDHATAAYYEFHSNVACTSDVGARRFFDEEAVGDYVSDPGIYDDNGLGVGHSDKELKGSDCGCRSEDVKFGLKETCSEGGFSDMELISQQDPSKLHGCDMLVMSHESPSSVDNSNKEVAVTLPKNMVESPHSEDTPQAATSFPRTVQYPEEAIAPILKQKPWWKVFLVTHRNIHRDQNALICSPSPSKLLDASPALNAAGYSSDADCYSGAPLFASGVLQPESIASGPTVKSGEVLVPTDEEVIQKVIAGDSVDTKDFQPVQFVASPISPEHHIQGIRKGKVLKAFQYERPDLRRVEEWISSIDPIALPAEEEFEITAELDAEPTSPSAPAASFFRTKGFRSNQVHPDGGTLLDRRDQHGDVQLDADSEMASMIAQSVNPLSTVAHFSGVGLKLMPHLGTYHNLKTLNFSANALVRIIPGYLPKSLHSLDLSRNKIAVLEGLHDLTRLRVLNLSFNRISRMGHGLANCSSLRELHLAGNKISEVEGLHRLLKVNYIDLSFNKLTSAKSIGQLAANYNTLQAINLLGNPLHSNLGEEPLRKLVSGLAPHVLYLNKQALKSVPARDALVDSVAKVALATSHHHHQRGKSSTHGKTHNRRGGPSALPAGPTSYALSHHRHKATTTHGGHSGLSKSRAPSEMASHHRHPHSNPGQGIGFVKDHSHSHSRRSHTSLVSLAQSSLHVTEKDGHLAGGKTTAACISRVRSHGSLHI